MRGQSAWNYHPYSLLNDLPRRSLPFVCRLAPEEHGIAFEWIDAGFSGPHRAFCRVWGASGPWKELALETPCASFGGLESGREYELFVSRTGESGRSASRRFFTGPAVGTVVNYLHPADPLYDFSGRSLCSPSLVKLPSGRLVASMDVFSTGQPQNLTLLFFSDDGGVSWRYLNDLLPCFWGKLFVFHGDLFLLANTTEYGSLVIGRSSDEGKTWSAPVLLFPGGGISGQGPHRAPMPVAEHRGRLFTGVDYGSWAAGGFGSGLLSVRTDSDLMDPESWSYTEPLRWNPAWPGAPRGRTVGALEGNAVPGPDGEIYEVLRFQAQGCEPAFGKALVLRGTCADPDAPLSFAWFADFNGGSNSKFDLQYDPQSGAYWAIADEIVQEEHAGARTVLSLFVSRDLKTFKAVKRLIDRRYEDPSCVGFQYVSFLIDGDDILFLCRSAFNRSKNFHDANYSTFHRIPSFRSFLLE